MGFKEKEVLDSFVCTQNFIIVLVFDIFANLDLHIKSKKYKNGYLDYYTTTSLVITLNSSKIR